jgi:hypothetical protein
MRTSAEKNFCLCARIEKEISREIDRAQCARNFGRIARSRVAALEAFAHDRNFLRRRAILSNRCACDQRDRKNIFSSRQIC